MADLTTTDLTTQPVGANLGVATTMPVSGFQPMPSTWEEYQAQQGPMMTMDIKPWQTGEYSGMSAKDAYESYAKNYNANPSANYIGDVSQMPVGTGGLSSLTNTPINMTGMSYANEQPISGSGGVSYGGNFVQPTAQTNTVNFNASNSGGGMDLFNATASTNPTQRTEANVAGYAQPYVSDLLSSTQAYVDAGVPAYTGQLTAGYSPLQQQAWQRQGFQGWPDIKQLNKFCEDKGYHV